MRVHHLNCGTMCPLGGRLMDGRSRGLHAHLVCHCLAIETATGLVLVDTGFGTRDVADPSRLPGLFRVINNIRLRAEDTAVAQLRRLGFDPADVRHIVVTHLDFDHAGGLEDFPNATVHVTAREKAAADAGDGNRMVGRARYRPRQWDEVTDWATYPMGGGEPWYGFSAVRDLKGLPPEILLVPLMGHTRGHSGVAIDTGNGWLLHAGDAYFHAGEMGQGERHCPPLARAYQRLMEVDRRARLWNQHRLRRLSLEAWDVRIICSHDSAELADCGQPAARPEPVQMEEMA